MEAIKNEEVDEYSAALGKLFRWVKLTLEVRFEDVKLRRATKKALAHAREEALKAEKERVEKRAATHEEKKKEFDERT